MCVLPTCLSIQKIDAIMQAIDTAAIMLQKLQLIFVHVSHGLQVLSTSDCMKVPLFMAEGMASKAAALFASLREWGSQGMQKPSSTPAHASTCRFRIWRPEYVHMDGPCVLFATPGMLQGGISLQVFKEWAPDKNNLVIIPGTCAAGTTVNKLMYSKKVKDTRVLQLDGQELTVRCKVCHLLLECAGSLTWTHPHALVELDYPLSARQTCCG